MNENIIKQILDQAPDSVTREHVTELYTKYDGNIVCILTELWNIEKTDAPEPKNTSVEELAFKNKIAEVRDICNSFDEEMENFLQRCRQDQEQSKMI